MLELGAERCGGVGDGRRVRFRRAAPASVLAGYSGPGQICQFSSSHKPMGRGPSTSSLSSPPEPRPTAATISVSLPPPAERAMSGGARRVLEAWRLGVVKYGEALQLQERLVADRKAGRAGDLVLSLQHPPTYTLGNRREKAERNLLAPEAELRALGAEVHRTERGGDVTFHGPRQAVLYPVLSLRALGLGARRYVEALESAMVQVAALHGVSARPGDPGETGVWVGDRKIGAIGVRISSGITWHGLAFNIDPDLGYFDHIVPCGIAGKGVTSLRREVEDGVVLPADAVIHDQLVRCLATTLGFTDVEFKDDSECGDMMGSAAAAQS